MDNSLISLCKHALTKGVKHQMCTQYIGVLKQTDRNYKDGKLTSTSEIRWDGTTVCSAGLRNGRKDWEGVDAIVSVSRAGYDAGRSYRDGDLTKAEAMAFYDILINHTPFGKCIVTTDTEEAYEKGLIIDTHYPCRLIAGTLMAQRLAWEHTKISKSALHYAGMGVHKGLAFLLGHAYSKTGASVHNNWHVALDSGWISPTYIRNFILGIYKSDGNFCDKKCYQTNVNATWGGKEESDNASNMRSAIANYAKAGFKEQEVMNPFAKSLVLNIKQQDDAAIAGYFDEHLADILYGKV